MPKNTNKTVPQCQRAQVETYIQCTLPGGPGKPTNAQDAEFDDIWKKTCSAPSVKAIEDCRDKTDSGNTCERERNDNDMKCLLDNTKTRAESDLVHNTCSASAIATVNDYLLTNNKARRTLPQCQREQWDACPECLKKNAP